MAGFCCLKEDGGKHRHKKSGSVVVVRKGGETFFKQVHTQTDAKEHAKGKGRCKGGIWRMLCVKREGKEG
jgi:hypothetical protein